MWLARSVLAGREVESLFGNPGNPGNHLRLAAAIPLKAAGVDIRKPTTYLTARGRRRSPRCCAGIATRRWYMTGAQHRKYYEDEFARMQAILLELGLVK